MAQVSETGGRPSAGPSQKDKLRLRPGPTRMRTESQHLGTHITPGQVTGQEPVPRKGGCHGVNPTIPKARSGSDLSPRLRKISTLTTVQCLQHRGRKNPSDVLQLKQHLRPLWALPGHSLPFHQPPNSCWCSASGTNSLESDWHFQLTAFPPRNGKAAFLFLFYN